MEQKQLDTQNFYPKYLDQDEINDPLTVIRDFFHSDWLPGHQEALLEWRKCVIQEGYYKGDRDNPASLLYTHQLNARLVEAVYVLSQTKKTKKIADAIHINFDEQLQQEEREWLHYPVYLSSVERINPYLAIGNFFKVYSVDQYRDFLYEWLETGLSKDAVDESLDVSDVIYFYENMQKLYEAVWIIRQREIEPVIKKKDDDEPQITAEVKRFPNSLSLIRVNCAFNEMITPEEKHGLNQLKELILSEVRSVLMIVHLGTHPSPATYYLLIITEEKDKTPEHSIVDKVEQICKPFINVCAIVHKSDAFMRALNEGNRFFMNALARNKIAYQSENLVLPDLKHIDNLLVKTQAETIWNRWGKQAKDFLDTSLNCYDDGNYNLALFLMHQAVESTLSAIIRVNLGYRLAIHNLARQLRITLIFTDDFKTVFDLGSVEGIQLFEFLQTGYSAGRYKDDFNADKEVVKALSDKVCKLFIIAEEIYKQAMETLKV
ncbi:HEPN domain-containing protein [Mucilaginibacter sp. HD30]